MKRMYALAVYGCAVIGWAAQGWAGGACGAAEKGACATAKTEMKAEAAAHAEGYGVIDTAGLKKLMDVKTPMALADARSGKWDDGKRIPGAIAIAPDSPVESIEKALPDKNQLIVAYCSNLKCPASKALAERLLKLGYKNVLKYPEGIEGWMEAGQPVTEAGQ